MLACHRVNIVDAVRDLTNVIQHCSEEQLSFAICCHSQMPDTSDCFEYTPIASWVRHFNQRPHECIPIRLAQDNEEHKENDNSRPDIFMTLFQFILYSAKLIRYQLKGGVQTTSIKDLNTISVDLLNAHIPIENISRIINSAILSSLESCIYFNIKHKMTLFDYDESNRAEIIEEIIRYPSLREIKQARGLQEKNTKINELKQRNFELSQQNRLLEEKVARLEGLPQKQANTLNNNVGLLHKNDNTSNHSVKEHPKRNAVSFSPRPLIGLFTSAFLPIDPSSGNNGHRTGEEKGKEPKDIELDTSTRHRQSGKQTPHPNGIS